MTAESRPRPRHQHRPRLRSVPRLVAGAVRHLWASDVNVAAVALLAPRPGERVVDLGSGLGPATGLLTGRVGPGGTVTAIDPSRILRTILRARTRLSRPPRARVSPGTAESLPLPSHSVDAIISLNAMHHMDDLARAAAELDRTLGAGGRLLLVDEDFDHPAHSMHEGGGPSQHGLAAVDPERVAGLLRDAGFAAASGRRDIIGGEPALVVEGER